MSERQASTYARGTGTPAHNAAMAILSGLKVPYRSEVPFLRPGEFNARLQQLYYFVDILCYPDRTYKLAVEVEGRGSKSAGNLKREEWLANHGVAMLHVANGTVLKTPLRFAALVALAWTGFDAAEGARLQRAVCERLANDR